MINKIKNEKLIESINIFKSSWKMLSNFKGKKISDLKDKTLLDYHKKTHMLYAGNIKRKPVNKKLINDIVILHDKIVKEMIKRKFNHNSPLEKIK